eukprot:1181334-Prorocentrum_minimum.AAC.3
MGELVLIEGSYDEPRRIESMCDARPVGMALGSSEFLWLWKTKPSFAQFAHARPHADVKGNSADVKGNSADVKGNSADVKGNSADVKGNSADVKGNSADVKGNLMLVTVRALASVQRLLTSLLRDELPLQCPIPSCRNQGAQCATQSRPTLRRDEIPQNGQSQTSLTKYAIRVLLSLGRACRHNTANTGPKRASALQVLSEGK